MNLVIIIVLLAAAALIVLWLRGRARRRQQGRAILETVFLQITVPKEVTATDKEREAAKEEKEIIAVAEQLFATLAHRKPGGLRSWWYGQESFSFELLAHEKKITFYLSCPGGYRDLLEKQIQAQYPASQIDEVLPPLIVTHPEATVACELGLSKPYWFPLKTYKNMETDPLNALANSLSKLGSDEAGAIQLILRPAGSWWRHGVLQKARAIQRHKTLEAAGNFMVRFWMLLHRAKKQAQKGQMTQENGEYYRQLTPMQQEVVKRMEEKAAKNAFLTDVRVVISSPALPQAQSHLRNVLASFMQYSNTPMNGMRVRKRATGRVLRDFVFRAATGRILTRRSILNTEELASLFHPPTKFTQTPNILWLTAKRAPAPVNLPQSGLLLGVNIYRGVRTEIRIGSEDRRRHMYCIGRTGTGKSEFLKNLARQDIESGQGVCVIDPHGDLVDDLLEFVPRERSEDVVIFAPFDMERPMGLNMLEVASEEEKDFAVQEMIEIFYKLFPPEMIGPMFEHNMRNVMLTLMADRDNPGTIAEIPRMFTDTEFQRYKVSKVSDLVVRAFWEQEMAKTTDFHKSEMLGYLISKVGRFVENEMMRNIIGQPKSAFNLREIMDHGKILLVNLSKGKTGEVNSKLLGLIIVSKLQMAAMSRADLPAEARRDFYLYVDEFQNFVTDSLATILSEARKYRLNLIMAHQYIGQLVHDKNTKIRDAVFGNAGTMIAFRVGVEDAEVMAREFAPVFNEFDLINIDRFHAYVKLMVNGSVSRPFNMQTLPPPTGGARELAAAIRNYSRLKYASARDVVQAEIARRAALGRTPPTAGAVERTF